MQKQKFLNSDTNSFHKCVKAFIDAENRRVWSPTELDPTKSDKEMAEILAEHFNDIRSEYQPLDVNSIPSTYDSTIEDLQHSDIIRMIKESTKPKSRVSGDIFVHLFTRFPNSLATPVCNVFNAIKNCNKWPLLWKIEYVTVIPKVSNPTAVSECRNISCTNWLSKLFEKFVLKWARREVNPRWNQYGGEKGCGTTHFLVNATDNILNIMEDSRAAAMLTSIDYSKAFNRLEHEPCLQAFATKGASNQIIKLLAAFLHEKRMTVRVGKEWSHPRQVNAGAPHRAQYLAATFSQLALTIWSRTFGTNR